MRRPRSRKCFPRRRTAVGTAFGGDRPRRRMLWSDDNHVSSPRSRVGGRRRRSPTRCASRCRRLRPAPAHQKRTADEGPGGCAASSPTTMPAPTGTHADKKPKSLRARFSARGRHAAATGAPPGDLAAGLKAPAPATEAAAPARHRHWQQAVRKQRRRFGTLRLPMKTVRGFLLYLQGRLQGVGAGSLLPPANALAAVDDRGQSAGSGVASRA